MLESSGVARLCYVEVVMGVKMGWIQIKMSHPLAQNGAALAHFVLTKHTLVYQVQKLSSTQGNFCASSCLPIKWHTSHCSTGKNWHEGVAEQLLPFIENKEMKVIVYVDFVKDAAPLAIYLRQAGYKTCAYHGQKMSAHDKLKSLESWKSGIGKIMVCTTAFGMGIDQPDYCHQDRMSTHFGVYGSGIWKSWN